LDPARLNEPIPPGGPAADPPDGFPISPVQVWYPPQRQRKFQDRVWRHVVLLLMTVFTTTYVGAGHYLSFASDLATRPLAQESFGFLMTHGLWYSGTILAILGCHELGHYLACRYYDVDASLPFFLPAPLPLTGTLGAFIKIREPIPSKRMLFDIGIAGPLAGFLVVVPALLIGISMSRVVALPANQENLSWLGEPLMFRLISTLLWGTPPEGYTLNLHPVAFAGWFGLLATALNLFPIGQLDGGHISYAVLGKRSSHLTLVMIAGAIVLTALVSLSWLVWTLMVIVMLAVFGRHHPRTWDEDVPLDGARKVLALAALAVFILCFTPAPIQQFDLIKH
jgi:membrane-associated protease RseP (regulator of RpoE activity)